MSWISAGPVDPDITRQCYALPLLVRARVEHPFRILKRIFGFDKVRFRGLAKNHHRLCASSRSSICRSTANACSCSGRSVSGGLQCCSSSLTEQPNRHPNAVTYPSPNSASTQTVNRNPAQNFLRHSARLITRRGSLLHNISPRWDRRAEG